jgi:hypothetical protein
VSQVITCLTQDDWYKRPSAKAVLYTSFPLMTIYHPNATLPFQQYIYEMYEYLAGFHLRFVSRTRCLDWCILRVSNHFIFCSEWSRRLYLADKWVDWICDLDDEVGCMLHVTFGREIWSKHCGNLALGVRFDITDIYSVDGSSRDSSRRSKLVSQNCPKTWSRKDKASFTEADCVNSRGMFRLDSDWH